MGVVGKEECPEKNKNKKSLTHFHTMPQAAGKNIHLKTLQWPKQSFRTVLISETKYKKAKKKKRRKKKLVARPAVV